MLIYNILIYTVYTYTVIYKEKYLQNKGNKKNEWEMDEKKKERRLGGEVRPKEQMDKEWISKKDREYGRMKVDVREEEDEEKHKERQ